VNSAHIRLKDFRHKHSISRRRHKLQAGEAKTFKTLGYKPEIIARAGEKTKKAMLVKLIAECIAHVVARLSAWSVVGNGIGVK
jgi:hypothetical protein